LKKAKALPESLTFFAHIEGSVTVDKATTVTVAVTKAGIVVDFRKRVDRPIFSHYQYVDYKFNFKL